MCKAIQAEYATDDSAGLFHLLSAARAEDDIERMRKQVEKEGDVVSNRLETKNANPLLQAIRGAEAVKRHEANEENPDHGAEWSF